MTPEQMQADIDFLARRQQRAGSVTFERGRDVGISSNSLVSLAYGVGKSWEGFIAAIAIVAVVALLVELRRG